jgi:MFS family permease
VSTETRRARFATGVLFFIQGLIVASWVSRIPSVERQLSLSSGILGTALLGIAVGSLAAMPLAGGLIARYGSRPVSLWTTYAFCIALASVSLARDAFSLTALLVFYGAAAGAMDVSMNAQGVTVQSRYGRSVMSSFHALFSIGGMTGAALGGAIASFGVSVGVHFLSAGLVCAAMTAACGHWLISPEHEDTAPEAPHFSLPSRPVLALGALAFCILLCEGAMADWTAIYLRDYLAAGATLAAAGYAVFSATMSIGRLLGDRWTDAFGGIRITRWGSLFAAVGLLLAFAAPSVPYVLLGFAAAGIGYASIIPNVFAAAARRPGLPAGAGIAAVTTTGFFGFLVGPPLIGWLAEWITLRSALLTLVGLSLLGAALAGALRDE